jgi:cell division control protein 6
VESPQSPRDIISQSASGLSVFKDRSKLSPDHVPSKLPYREQKLRELGVSFKGILESPGASSLRGLIVGKTGTGKTVTARVFGREFRELARNREVKLEYVHVNCYRQRTLYMITSEVAGALRLPVPMRGFSSQEVFRAINDYLEKRNMYLIITLDEFDYLINTAPPSEIYFLVRLYDEIASATKRINYLFIVRDWSTVNLLDKSLRDHVVRNVIEFKPYTASELYGILEDRVKEAFHEGTVPSEVLELVSEIHGYDRGGTGNARLAIEVLELAGDIADKRGNQVITREIVKEANARASPESAIMIEGISTLDLHELLTLYSIIRLSESKRGEYLTMGVVEEEYASICKELGEEPRKHTQFYEYVRKMKMMGVLDTKQSGRGMRGRTTLIALNMPYSRELRLMVESRIKAMAV